MERQKLLVGSITTASGGVTLDTTRVVEFDGEKLAELHQAGMHKGGVSDTRGTKETLYRAEDGRLVVHTEDWSHWQAEPTTYILQEVTEDDLQGTGRYAMLGLEAGMGGPLTLDQALAGADVPMD